MFLFPYLFKCCYQYYAIYDFNFYSWTGLRDDLTFLFDEELTQIPLCSLHCEMRNTEQLLGSLGLFAHRCGSLEECNSSLANYGPEVSRGKNRIQIKKREKQETAVSKSNIKVKSFSGKCYKIDNFLSYILIISQSAFNISVISN